MADRVEHHWEPKESVSDCDSNWVANSERGVLSIGHTWQTFSNLGGMVPPETWTHVQQNPPRPGSGLNWPYLGFAWNFRQVVVIPRFVAGHWVLSLPYWGIAFVSALPLVFMKIGGARRATRRKSGCCVKCGYDLRATQERCPECGEKMCGAIQNAER